MATIRKTATTLAVTFALLSGAVSATVRDSNFLGIAGHGGTGKHPKTSQVGVLIDGSLRGLHLFCFSYALFTDAKVKGSIDVDIDVIEANRVRKLTTLNRMTIENFDLDNIPPPDDACVPEYSTDFPFNFGFASDCVSISTTLRSGDVVRWKVRFKKPAKLRGDFASLGVSGFLIPSASAAGLSALEIENLLVAQRLESFRNRVLENR